MLKPSRPYILKALYDWLLDSDLTPHLLVNAEEDQVNVPVQFVDDGQIVLNINPSAIRDFYMDDEAVSFNARFSGKPTDIYVPVRAIMAIYARENGQGMGFGSEPGVEFYLNEPAEIAVQKDKSQQPGDSAKMATKKTTLKVIK